MKRRQFVMLLGSTAAAWPFASHAQQRKAMPRVGVLWHAASAKEEEEYLGALTKAFHELGYFEGKNIDLEHRFPAEQPERFRALAQDFAESKVDVIVAVTGLGAREAKRATSTIPIVLVADPDPVGNRLVESLARPGGNVTGLSLMAVDLSGKRLSLFKEAVPKLASVAILGDPRDPLSKVSGVAYERAAKAMGISTQIFDVKTADKSSRRFRQSPAMVSMAHA
jgi:putative ABC transport system substrate-binding protein